MLHIVHVNILEGDQGIVDLLGKKHHWICFRVKEAVDSTLSRSIRALIGEVAGGLSAGH